MIPYTAKIIRFRPKGKIKRLAIFIFKAMSATLDVKKSQERTITMTKQPKTTKTARAEAEEPKHLYLMRHGKASKKEKYGDADRPLAKRGRKDVKKLKKMLRAMELKPDLILCSPAARTRETLERVMDVFDGTEVVFDEMLYDAEAGEIIGVLNRLPSDKKEVLLIGHNPSLAELVALSKQHDIERFPTASLACIEIKGEWNDFSPENAHFVGAARH